MPIKTDKKKLHTKELYHTILILRFLFLGVNVLFDIVAIYERGMFT